MANPRVHEIAAELGIESMAVLDELARMGSYVKGPSSSVPPPVARKVRKELLARGIERAPAIGAIEMRSLAERAARLSHSLPQALPELVGALRSAAGERWGKALDAGGQDGNLFFVEDSARAQVLAGGSNLAISRDLVELPSVSGIALVGQSVVVAWSPVGAGAQVSSAALSLRGEPQRMMAGVHEYETIEVDEGFFRPRVESRTGPVAILAGISLVIPVMEVEESKVSVGGGERRPGTGTTEDRAVRILYLTRRRVTGQTRSGARVATIRTSQWRVRGHWRNQWYPSLQAHRRVWIADHTAGPVEAPMREGDRVYVIRPNLDSEA